MKTANIRIVSLVSITFCVISTGCTSLKVATSNEKSMVHESGTDWKVVKSWDEKTEKTVKIWPGTVSLVMDWCVAPFDGDVRSAMFERETELGSWLSWGFSPVLLPFTLFLIFAGEEGAVPCYSMGHSVTSEHKEIVLRSGAGFYPGPDATMANKVKLTINSEPQGARIYENDKCVGVTPCVLSYTLDERSYRQGFVGISPLTAALEGYLSSTMRSQIPIETKWKYNDNGTYEAKKGVLFFLSSDPNRPPSSNLVQRPNYTEPISPQQPDNSAERRAAQAEYDGALAAYKEARKSYDNARNVKSLNDMSNSNMMSGNNLMKGVGLFNQATGHLGVQQAERNLEEARDRLDQAKSRLNGVNYR